MNTFAQLEEEWKTICSNEPSLVSMLEEKVVLLLLNTDEAFVKQGIEILMSFGSSGLCFLLEEENSEIKIVSAYPNLSQWKMRDLRHIQKSFNLPKAKSKAVLVERINESRGIRLRIERCVMEEVIKEESDWFGLFENGSFDGMWHRIFENTDWSSLSETLQERLLKEVRQMVEVPGKKYSIGKYVVTQSFWESVMGSNPSHFKGSSLPVETVTWFDCVLFCNKLSEKEGLEKAYTINGEEVECNFDSEGYRLPTDWEWWFAAKANQDFEFAGSDDIDEVAWYGEDYQTGSTHGVGQKKANGFGLYDMSGNVCEWCWDWFEGDYEGHIPTEGSTGPSAGSFRVFRGGCWYFVASYARVSYRGRNLPSFRFNPLGFRFTRTIR